MKLIHRTHRNIADEPIAIAYSGGRPVRIQVCFPEGWSDDRLLAWTNLNVIPQQAGAQWEFFRRYDPLLDSALRRVPCPLRPDYEHVLFTASLPAIANLFMGQSTTTKNIPPPTTTPKGKSL